MTCSPSTALLVSIGLLSAASSAAAQPAAIRLTMDEAVTLALAHNRTIASAAMDVAKADESVATARSRRLPTFRIDGQMSQLLRPVEIRFPEGAFGTFEGIGPVPSAATTIKTSAQPTFYLNAQVGQPLTGLKEIGLNIRLSEAARALEREDLRSQQLAVAAEVKRLYSGILRTESALTAADASIDLLREVDRVMTDRATQRVALKSDALDVRTRRARAEDSRLTLQHNLASQKEQLNLLLGRDVLTPFDVAGVPAATLVEVDLTAARRQALESRPDLKRARLQHDQADLAEKIARADTIPDVSLAASYLSPFNIDGAPRSIASVSVKVEWEPFDWGRRRRAIATRDLERQQTAVAVREAEDRAVVDVHTQFRRIEAARSRLKVAAMALDSAHEVSRVRTTQFKVNAALLQDVLQAGAALADAENEHQQALADFWQARADFERAIGQDVMP
jgi:outer membrane protein TolC